MGDVTHILSTIEGGNLQAADAASGLRGTAPVGLPEARPRGSRVSLQSTELSHYTYVHELDPIANDSGDNALDSSSSADP